MTLAEIAVEDVVPEFEFLSDEAVDDLTYREQVAYTEVRTRFIEWMRRCGRHPMKAEPLSDTSVANYARRLHQIFQWFWSNNEGFTARISHRAADEYVDALLYDDILRHNGEAYTEGSKRKFVNVLQKWFEWREHEFDAEPWKPRIIFVDGSPENQADYFTRAERAKLVEASLRYGSLPDYKNISPEERNRAKAHLAQVLGKPKEEITRSDWKHRSRSWKIPSLVSVSLDAGLRPIEVNRMKTEWVRLQKWEIHIPKDEAAKNREQWSISIRERTADILERWLKQRDTRPVYDGKEEVWLNQKGNPYTSKTLNYLLGQLLEEAGIDQQNRRLTWYSIRHSTGTYVQNQSDIATAASVLRHKDLRSTHVYTHPPSEEKRKVLESIDG